MPEKPDPPTELDPASDEVNEVICSRVELLLLGEVRVGCGETVVCEAGRKLGQCEGFDSCVARKDMLCT